MIGAAVGEAMNQARAMISNGKQGIGIERQINPYDLCLFIYHMIKKPGVLMTETIVVLSPDVR